MLLGGPEDTDLLWLAAALQRIGEQAEVVLPEELVGQSKLTYRIDRAAVSSTLRLRERPAIDEAGPSLVINRLTEIPVRPTASAIDTAYLGEEWRAALVAWLRTLRCPVLNPPRAASLSGPAISMPAWRALARAHGLSCRPWTSDDVAVANDPIDLIVVVDRCLSAGRAIPETVRASLCRMAQFVGAPLLGVRLDRADDEWQFIDATAFPPLAQGGQALVAAVAQLSKDRQKTA